MRKNSFAEEQIIKVLKERAAGLSTSKSAASTASAMPTFYKW